MDSLCQPQPLNPVSQPLDPGWARIGIESYLHCPLLPSHDRPGTPGEASAGSGTPRATATSTTASALCGQDGAELHLLQSEDVAALITKVC
ncbi:hypothetical protein GH733_018373 [Mirounga leonina]|nr:hypothetical protein GH733_018373 [Mirounga leonina]